MNLDDLNSEDYFNKTSDFYEFKEVLGKGAFGTVISAFNTHDKSNYAIKVSTFHHFCFKDKVIQKQTVPSSSWEQLRQEAFIMSELSHPNIVKFKDVSYFNGILLYLARYEKLKKEYI